MTENETQTPQTPQSNPTPREQPGEPPTGEPPSPGGFDPAVFQAAFEKLSNESADLRAQNESLAGQLAQLTAPDDDPVDPEDHDRYANIKNKGEREAAIRRDRALARQRAADAKVAELSEALEKANSIIAESKTNRVLDRIQAELGFPDDKRGTLEALWHGLVSQGKADATPEDTPEKIGQYADALASLLGLSKKANPKQGGFIPPNDAGNRRNLHDLQAAAQAATAARWGLTPNKRK